MTRQSEFRRQPGHARLTPPAVFALPSPAQSRSALSLAPGGSLRPQGAAAPARAIPAISIHAFCDSTAAAAELEAASTDRRLAKAHVEISTGGIDAALAECAAGRTPNILVMETALPPPQMLAKLDVIADSCDPAARIMLVGHVNDIALYREVLSRGISEYLVAPVSPQQFIEAVARLCGAQSCGEVGRIAAFIGAKGGAGSSTICHNAAWAISELLKCQVVVADLDMAFGTAGLDFNQETMQGMAEALHAPDRLEEALLDRLLTKCSQHLSILAAPAAIDRDYEISSGACRTVLDALRQYAPFAAVDLPHVWAPWVKQVLISADEIVITAAPDLANLRNAKNFVDFLESTRHSGGRPRLVINMARQRKRPELSVEEFASVLELEPALVIEFDPETFGLAANNGQMIEEFSRKARPAQQFRELALALTRRSEPRELTKPSPLAPIFDKLGLG
ncbi:MAG: CtpF protein [Hyphomicrobiaceae bacterium]|nr:CtpF protein [Hyphomicrobiaceae bacterium]